jgi:nicotinamidase-related amidase
MQDRFRRAIPDFAAVEQNIATLARGFGAFGMPVIVTEQYPQGLGKTVYEIVKATQGEQPIEKMTISCTANETFCRRVRQLALQTLVVCGIESHVCVNQTVLGLVQQGKSVHVVADAVSSRKQSDTAIALQKMTQAGAIPTTVEMALFELAQRAGTEEFKTVQRLVR